VVRRRAHRPEAGGGDGAGAVCGFPSITVVNLADVLDRIESVVDQVTFVVRFLAGFSIFAG